MNLFGWLRVLGLNAVPVGGVMLAGWSTSTGLALYWCETLLGTATNAMRIAAHRRMTHKRGHFRGQLGIEINAGDDPLPRRRGRGRTEWRSFLTEYLVGSLVFTLVHGLFLAILLGAFIKIWPSRDELLYGLLAITLFQAGGLAFDLLSLRDWPFARLKTQVQGAMGRVVLVHIAILFGMALVFWLDKPSSFFWVFGGLKTATDLGGLLGARSGAKGDAATPAAAPAWAKAIAVKLSPGENLDDYWRSEHERERREAAEDEEVMGPATR